MRVNGTSSSKTGPLFFLSPARHMSDNLHKKMRPMTARLTNNPHEITRKDAANQIHRYRQIHRPPLPLCSIGSVSRRPAGFTSNTLIHARRKLGAKTRATTIPPPPPPLSHMPTTMKKRRAGAHPYPERVFCKYLRRQATCTHAQHKHRKL
ncbi:unnamed protein product [Ectocarpus sp. 8 AP-2014]